ncbi:Glycosylinositol phosphorylceramide mannosyl transferase 1-like protein [Drosera capensis]
MSTTMNLIPIRDSAGAGEHTSITTNGNSGGFYSPAKEKAATRGGYGYGNNGYMCRWSPLIRRLRQPVAAAAKFKAIETLMGWSFDSDSSAAYRGGYTVLINTWKRDSLLKKSVAHYASCRGTDAIHVVWSESDPPSADLKSYLKRTVLSKSEKANKPNFRFDLNEEDNLNNRFKPISELRTDAIFSVDDDVIVPCGTLDFAFTVWQTAPSTMVGFVPRMHWLSGEKNGVADYEYGGWWSVWWMGTYSMVLSKAAFFHRKYLDLYTYKMPASIRDYVTKERNCEDIAMSFLVANATGAPPVWVKGKIYEIGSAGISSLNGHTYKRKKCLNDFVSLYGRIPLLSTNLKAVHAGGGEWFW